jgi:glycosyltransferase involved in cell wall biosynthesis
LERVIYDLALGLNELGVDVTVACPTESRLPGDVQHLDIGPAKYQVQQNWVEAEQEAYVKYRQRMKEFDITHDHSWFGWPYMARSEDGSLKVIHTHHGHLNWRTPPPGRHANLVGISRFMAAIYSRQLGVPTRFVYNGVDLESCPFTPTRGERMIYIGRIAKFKQPHLAIDVAKRAGVPIDVLGGDRFVDDFAYVTRVKAQCDGTNARYVGEVPNEEKMRYLQKSRAVLICSQMAEPFGLVAVEALASGRPVICLDDGALKEIVTSSVGFICQTPEEMVETIKVGKDLSIRPENCRRRAEEFSKEKMAQGYRELYHQIIKGNEW